MTESSKARKLVFGLGSFSYLDVGIILPGYPLGFSAFSNALSSHFQDPSGLPPRTRANMVIAYHLSREFEGIADGWISQRTLYAATTGQELYTQMWKGAQLYHELNTADRQEIIDALDQPRVANIVLSQSNLVVVDIGSAEAKCMRPRSPPIVERTGDFSIGRANSWLEVMQMVGSFVQATFKDKVNDASSLLILLTGRHRSDLSHAIRERRGTWGTWEIRVITSEMEAKYSEIAVYTAVHYAGFLRNAPFQIVGTCEYGGGSTQGYMPQEEGGPMRLFFNNIGTSTHQLLQAIQHSLDTGFVGLQQVWEDSRDLLKIQFQQG